MIRSIIVILSLITLSTATLATVSFTNKSTPSNIDPKEDKTIPLKKKKKSKKKRLKEISSVVDQSNSKENQIKSDEKKESSESKNSTATKRTITINNNVTPTMSTYKQWLASYKPTTFTLKANGKEIPENKPLTVETTDNKIELEYFADFYGIRTSHDKMKYKINPKADTLNLTFDWHKKPRIIPDKATIIQQ